MKKDQEVMVQAGAKFTWTIKNFSKLHSEKLYSDTFYSSTHPWRILIYPNAANAGDGFSVHLSAVGADSFPDGGKLSARFRLSLVNQFDRKMTKKIVTKYKFSATRLVSNGYKQLVNSAKFHDPSKGYLVDDTCIVVARVSVGKSALDRYSSSEESSNKNGELTDFKGLCEVYEYYIPLLDEVCLKHPTLIETHLKRKRSKEFNKTSFGMLGRVLQLLKTKKVKDMDEDVCDDLQYLWDEIEIRFDDLTWLEPHVQSALGMKNYMEKAAKVKKLKGIVVDLEGEIKSLKAKMVATETDIEIARRELMRAKEGFVERDLDDVIGYGMPLFGSWV